VGIRVTREPPSLPKSENPRKTRVYAKNLTILRHPRKHNLPHRQASQNGSHDDDLRRAHSPIQHHPLAARTSPNPLTQTSLRSIAIQGIWQHTANYGHRGPLLSCRAPFQFTKLLQMVAGSTGRCNTGRLKFLKTLFREVRRWCMGSGEGLLPDCRQSADWSYVDSKLRSRTARVSSWFIFRAQASGVAQGLASFSRTCAP
jgi:hypothetical protein